MILDILVFKCFVRDSHQMIKFKEISHQTFLLINESDDYHHRVSTHSLISSYLYT